MAYVIEDSIFNTEIGALYLRISRIALAELDSNSNMSVMSWPFTRCYLIQSGHGYIHTHDKTVEMKAGNIYILPSGLPCGYSGDGKLFKMWIHFTFGKHDTPDIFNKLRSVVVLEEKQAFIDEIISLYKKKELLETIKIKTMVYAIAAEALEKSALNKSDFPEYSKLIKEAVRYIERNRKFTFKAENLADLLGVKTLNIQRQFKKEVGVALGHYITDRVMVSAATELKNSSKSIKEISDELEFPDQFYFSSAFQRHYGIRPSDYRKDCMV